MIAGKGSLQSVLLWQWLMLGCIGAMNEHLILKTNQFGGTLQWTLRTRTLSSWASKASPPLPPSPRNKSLNQAISGPYFKGGGVTLDVHEIQQQRPELIKSVSFARNPDCFAPPIAVFQPKVKQLHTAPFNSSHYSASSQHHREVSWPEIVEICRVVFSMVFLCSCNFPLQSSHSFAHFSLSVRWRNLCSGQEHERILHWLWCGSGNSTMQRPKMA